MDSGWTPERRARQAEAIKRWRPWEQSTGPRTEAGKAAAAANGAKAWPHSGARATLRELRQVLREQREAVAGLLQAPCSSDEPIGVCPMQDGLTATCSAGTERRDYPNGGKQ